MTTLPKTSRSSRSRSASCTSSRGSTRSITGVTLAGTPFVVAGSNGQVAWSFTNSYGDWVDLVPLEPVGHLAYQGPEGPVEYERWTEKIEVAGEDAVDIECLGSVWGPVVGEDHTHRPVALRWTAHHPEAVSQGFERLERSRDVRADKLSVHQLDYA